MLLRYSHTSPYARKAVVLIHEADLGQRVALETIDAWAEPEHLIAENPLSMVPTLVLDDGDSLYDSRVICEYLDSVHAGPRLIPDDGDRWRVLRDQALADGMVDCAILIMLEQSKRPDALRWDWWSDIKRRAIVRSLDHCEASAGSFAGRLDIGVIALGAALGYLDLRGAVGEWRDGRPILAAWYADFSARPSMRASAPPT